MSAQKEGLTAAERAWLDEVKTRWQPLTEPQAAMVRRYFGPSADRIDRGAA